MLLLSNSRFHLNFLSKSARSMGIFKKKLTGKLKTNVWKISELITINNS